MLKMVGNAFVCASDATCSLSKWMWPVRSLMQLADLDLERRVFALGSARSRGTTEGGREGETFLPRCNNDGPRPT